MRDERRAAMIANEGCLALPVLVEYVLLWGGSSPAKGQRVLGMRVISQTGMEREGDIRLYGALSVKDGGSASPLGGLGLIACERPVAGVLV